MMFNDPWPYMIIDDFLTSDDFDRVKEQCIRSFDSGDIDTHMRYVDEDPVISYDISKYLKLFKHRPYSYLDKFIHFAKTEPNTIWTKHVEAPFKIMTAILYVSPEVNNGTRLYTPEMELRIETEWKPNRLFVFCGHDGITWHDFTSNEHERFTLNYFLVDKSVIKNEEYSSAVIG